MIHILLKHFTNVSKKQFQYTKHRSCFLVQDALVNYKVI